MLYYALLHGLRHSTGMAELSPISQGAEAAALVRTILRSQGYRFVMIGPMLKANSFTQAETTCDFWFLGRIIHDHLQAPQSAGAAPFQVWMMADGTCDLW